MFRVLVCPKCYDFFAIETGRKVCGQCYCRLKELVMGCEAMHQLYKLYLRERGYKVDVKGGLKGEVKHGEARPANT